MIMINPSGTTAPAIFFEKCVSATAKLLVPATPQKIFRGIWKAFFMIPSNLQRHLTFVLKPRIFFPFMWSCALPPAASHFQNKKEFAVHPPPLPEPDASHQFGYENVHVLQVNMMVITPLSPTHDLTEYVHDSMCSMCLFENMHGY